MLGRDLAALAGQESVIVIRRPFVAWLGSVADALLMDQCLYWQSQAGAGQWWHRSDAEIAERLCLTVYAVAKSRAALSRWLAVERRGVPARMYYCLDSDAAAAAFAASVLPNQGASSANSDNLLPGIEEHSYTDGLKVKPTANRAKALAADAAGTGKAPKARKPRTPKAPADPERAASLRAMFSDLCAAAGWSTSDLTTGNRVNLGKLAARILEEPEGDRPAARDLRGIYERRQRELSEQLRRPAGQLSVLQFREAIGKWIAARRESAARADETAALQAAAARVARGAIEAALSPAAVTWRAMQPGLRAAMPPATYQTWLSNARAESLDGGRLRVVVPGSGAAAFIRGRLSMALVMEAERAGIAGVDVVAEFTDDGNAG